MVTVDDEPYFPLENGTPLLVTKDRVTKNVVLEGQILSDSQGGRGLSSKVTLKGTTTGTWSDRV